MASRPSLPRNVWVLGFVSLFMDLSSEVYHALLPAFITIVLGLPVTALGAIDGVAEASANFAKLFSGRLSDRSLGASPGSCAAMASPPCRSRCSRSRPARRHHARALHRPHRQGHPRPPRDAMIADERRRNPRPRIWPEGKRSTLPAPCLPRCRHRADDAPSPAISAQSSGSRLFPLRSRSSRLAGVREPEQHFAPSRSRPSSPASATRQGHQAPAPGRLPVHARPLFRRLPDPQGHRQRPSAKPWSPLTLAIFNLAYVALAYPAGALSDRMSPRIDPDCRDGVLVAGDLVAREDAQLCRPGHRDTCGAPTWR